MNANLCLVKMQVPVLMNQVATDVTVNLDTLVLRATQVSIFKFLTELRERKLDCIAYLTFSQNVYSLV